MSRDRSRYIAKATELKLREREDLLIRACDVANESPDVLAIEREWDSMIDQTGHIDEPRTGAPAR